MCGTTTDPPDSVGGTTTTTRHTGNEAQQESRGVGLDPIQGYKLMTEARRGALRVSDQGATQEGEGAL